MIKKLRTDKDYEEAGVAPPEHIVHVGSEQILQDIHLHNWTAKGNYLHCEGGHTGTAHGIPYNHLNKIFVGTNSRGAPIFKDVVLSDKIPKLDTKKKVR